MKTHFQVGFDFGFFIFWRTVSPAKFAEKIKPMLLRPEQYATIRGEELLPFFQNDFVLRDGRKLYRAIT